MKTLVILIPLLPLIAAIVTALLGPHVLRRSSHWPTVVALIASFLCSVVLALQVRSASIGEVDSVGFERHFTLGWRDFNWQWIGVTNAYRPSQFDGTSGDVVQGGLRDLDIRVTLRADALTSIMLLMVTLVSSLVAIYSVGYMHGDRGYWRFFSYISLFVFSMTMLVSVSNFALLYVFWEAVGVCSYLLIGFWYEKPEAASAGKKAFLVNRVGDFGFALAIFLIWITYGTLNFHDTINAAGVFGQERLSGQLAFAGGGVGFAICVLLLVGACGKSAQFPLHVWLPDAMEGPTPVSALIHAATMVTAGVYMVARCTPLFMVSPDAQLVVAVIGGTTALLAGLIALTQFDLKRVLAYSTISQLGYMFLALGTGTLAGITAGMFHLFTHAFFKALLFLGAGSVMHAMGNVIDMRRFGGLRHLMPITHKTIAIGCLALAGIFPFAGFWSKDTILASVHDKFHHTEHVQHGDAPQASGVVITGADAANQYVTSEQARAIYRFLFYVALFTALLTSIYTFRAFFMTFYGAERLPHEAGHHAHESPGLMCVPLAVLAVFAVGIGAILELTHVFSKALANTPSLAYEAVRGTTQPGAFHLNIAIGSTIVAALGVGIAAYLYLGRRLEVELLKSFFQFEWARYFAGFQWVDSMARTPSARFVQRVADSLYLGWLSRLLGYSLVFVLFVLCSPLVLAHIVSPYKLSFRKFFFDEIYSALCVWPLRLLASISYALDRWIIDGLVDLCGRIPVGLGGLMRTLQMGLVPFYGLAMVLGMLTFIAARVLWGG